MGVERMGSRTAQRLLEAFGDVEQVLAATPEAITRRSGLHPDLAARIAGAAESPAFVQELRRVRETGSTLLTLDSPHYPARLRALPLCPPLLYARGTLPGAEAPWLAVVGTRGPTRYGERMTRELIAGLAARERGLVIVSGLARGIDTVAHAAALECGLPTVAVLGAGLGSVYPPENGALADQIAAGGGALLSEFALDAKPLARNFPIRNRVISGLADALLVIEAGERSGALITAGFAQNHGRPVLAVPGNVGEPTSEGTNRLLRSGQAAVALAAEDVWAALHGARHPRPTQLDWLAPDAPAARPTPHVALEGEKGQILACLRRGPLHPDDLAGETALPIERLVGLLLELELSGDIYQTAENQFALA
jgi:DNA processing protein